MAWSNFTRHEYRDRPGHVQAAAESERVGMSSRPWATTLTGSGEYQGLPAAAADFHPLWNDIRTGRLELFISTVPVGPPGT
jgi:hypothetical protein